MKCFSRGSEWRKWDLHVHPPGTKLSDGYKRKSEDLDWDRFCKSIHDSDVEAFGITDYFSFDSFFAFKENYQRLYPESHKIFFPNLELRLNEAVNKATEVVDFHIIFPPNLSQEEANEFLRELKTQSTDSSEKKLSCAQLKNRDDFTRATVSREDIKAAIETTYGKKAVQSDHVLLIAAANNSGIRADTKSQRKMNLADEIDKFANGFFGNPANSDYFSNPDRLEAPDQKAIPKPVFSGCDAHSFDDLEAWLGAEVTGDNDKHITWVKADLSFEGLQQTLIEPIERVRIQATKPDKKEPYKIISRITFSGSDDFPSEVIFNPGLNAIIGSRSSGKSALLAYIAHAVDPEYTVRQQVESSGMKEGDVGPGASITWNTVKSINYAVEWAEPEATTGQVIYVPQNSLYAISERPDDITAKIKPTVFRNDPDFAAKYRSTLTEVDNLNETIHENISDWFLLAKDIRSLNEDIRGLGDRKAITARQSELMKQIRELRESSALDASEIELYTELVGNIREKKNRLGEIEQEQSDLAPYLTKDAKENSYHATDQIKTVISMVPNPETMPNDLSVKLKSLLDNAQEALLEEVKTTITGYRAALDNEHQELAEAVEKLRIENRELLQKNAANAKVDSLVKDLKTQEEVLAKIGKKEALSATKSKEQAKLLASVEANISAREQLLETLTQDFNDSHNMLENVTFSIETGFDSIHLDLISKSFNKNATSEYLTNQKLIDIEKALSEPRKFIEYMGAGKQKLNQGENVKALTKAVLTTTKDVRFVASLEGDRIGGFKKSSMTPGKQALFALTLILAESDEPWPLLIDQPEDDLDSRSVCETIIKDLMRRKRERQIIMVSHNANLVIGADSEEIIVANRHGDDRPNRDAKMFAYLSGSIEHSQPKDPKAKFVLESAGIREHACEILDGGSEAFQKRKDKYRI